MTPEIDTRIQQVVTTALELSPAEFHNELALGTCPKWDSLAHMNLVVALESEFKIRFSTDEIPKLTALALIRRSVKEKIKDRS